MFNTTFSNISAISWRPVLVLEEAGVPEENHRLWASNWSTLSLAAASRLHPFLWFTKPGANPRRIGDRLVWVVRSSDLAHWATRAPYSLYDKVCLCYSIKKPTYILSYIFVASWCDVGYNDDIFVRLLHPYFLFSLIIPHSRVAGYRFLPICHNSMTHG